MTIPLIVPRAQVSIVHDTLCVDFNPHPDRWFFPFDNKRVFFCVLNNKIFSRHIDRAMTPDVGKTIEYALNAEIKYWVQRGDIIVDHPDCRR
jgi:hypothetical protein